MNTHCAQGHPLTGNVYIDPRGWAHCKVCRRESAHRYRHAHPERVKEAQKRWRTGHREYCNAMMRKWTAENPEKRAAIIWRYSAKKRAENRDGITKSQIA